MKRAKKFPCNVGGSLSLHGMKVLQYIARKECGGSLASALRQVVREAGERRALWNFDLSADEQELVLEGLGLGLSTESKR